MAYPKQWLSQLHNVCTTEQVAGLEKWWCVALVALRVLSLTYWLISWYPDMAVGPQRARRDRWVEANALVQLGILLVLWRAPQSLMCLACFVAGYLLFVLYLSLFNIVFLSKLATVNAPSTSVERSLLLLFLNLGQVCFTFAVFYRFTIAPDPDTALVNSLLVLGTVGHPLEATQLGSVGGYLVGLQIIMDLFLLVLFIGSLTGRIGVRVAESDGGHAATDEK